MRLWRCSSPHVGICSPADLLSPPGAQLRGGRCSQLSKSRGLIQEECYKAFGHEKRGGQFMSFKRNRQVTQTENSSLPAKFL